MKKVLMLVMLAVSFIACEGPMGPPGMDGRDGYGANWFSKSFTIRPGEWELKGKAGDLNSYFVAYKDMPELTESIYRGKSVIAYFQTDNGVKNGMPYVLHRGGVDDDGKEFLWTQTYDFDFTVGEVGFYLTYSDFNTQLRLTDPVTFHVVLMW